MKASNNKKNLILFGKSLLLREVINWRVSYLEGGSYNMAKEIRSLKQCLRHRISRKRISEITQLEIDEYKGNRLRVASMDNLNMHIAFINSAFCHALTEFGYNLRSPFQEVIKDSNLRRISMDEYKLLKLEALKLKNKVFLPSIVFLLETGVNLKKLTSLYWRDIDVKGRMLRGGIRLSDVAIIALNQAPVSKDGRVFGISLSNLSYYINKVTRKLGILNLTLSDLKKEGQSRMNGLRVEFGLPRLDFGCGIWPNSKTGRGAIISIRRNIDEFYKHSSDNSNWMPEDAESFSDYNEKAQKVIKKVVGILLPSSWEAVFDHARVKGLDVFDLVEIIKKNIFLNSHLET